MTLARLLLPIAGSLFGRHRSTSIVKGVEQIERLGLSGICDFGAADAR